MMWTLFTSFAIAFLLFMGFEGAMQKRKTLIGTKIGAAIELKGKTERYIRGLPFWSLMWALDSLIAGLSKVSELLKSPADLATAQKAAAAYEGKPLVKEEELSQLLNELRLPSDLGGKPLV